MKINLSRITAGRYGGAYFNGILRHFDTYIEQRINEYNFKSSFEELRITFAYPPLYMLPRVVSMRNDFLATYETITSSRMLRRYKKIDITIKAPEFAEHFDLKEQEKYKDKFLIDEIYQKKSEVDLAHILIEKYIAAIELFEHKLKSTDSFDTDGFKKILRTIKSEISLELLTKISEEETKIIKDNRLKNAFLIREKRLNAALVKNKKIRDLRVYYAGLPKRALYPYDYQYSEIFLNLLVRKGLMCPDYHHLYIQVGPDREELLRKSTFSVDWYVYGIAVIDYKTYQLKNENEKSQMVFDIICEGLLDITKIDKLDESIIRETIKEIKKYGFNTELIYKVIEHKKYKLTITYLARSLEEKCPIYFVVEDKLTTNKYKQKIGEINPYQIKLWLQKISLTQKKIKIKSSNSSRANVWLKGEKRQMEFDLEEIMKEKNRIK